MSIFSKEQDNYLDYISKQIVHQILNKNDQNQIIESLFKQTAEVLLEGTDFSKYEPNIRLMYKRAVSDSNKHLNKLILSRVGNKEGANDTARIYTVVKNYIVKKIFDLVATTIDFKNILKETKFSKFFKNKILFEAAPVTSAPSAPVTPVTPAPAPAPASDMKVDMLKFKPNTKADWVKYLGPTARQQGNFKTIVDTILNYINSQYKESLPSTAQNKEFYFKVKKIHELVKKTISNFLDKEISPKIMPEIDKLTKTKIKEYDDTDKSDAEYDKDKNQNNIMLLNKILKFVGLPDVNSIINQMKDEKTIEYIHDQIINKISKAKLSENNIKFIIATTKTVLNDNISTMKKDQESSFGKQMKIGGVALFVSLISFCVVVGTVIVLSYSYPKFYYNTTIDATHTSMIGSFLTFAASMFRTIAALPFEFFKEKRLNKIFKLMKQDFEKIQDKLNEPKPDEDSFKQDCPECHKTHTFKKIQIGKWFTCTNPKCEDTFEVEAPKPLEPQPTKINGTRPMITSICPTCRGENHVNADGIGKDIECNHCKRNYKVEDPKKSKSENDDLKINCPNCKTLLTITHQIFNDRLFHKCPHCEFRFNPYFWYYDKEIEEEEEAEKPKKKRWFSSFRNWLGGKNNGGKKHSSDEDEDEDDDD